MKNVQAVVEEHRVISGPFRLLTLHTPEIAALSQPGQFVHVKCSDTLDPLLRRPISLHKIDAQAGTISLLYQVVGRGTQLLAAKKPGDQVDLMGPLGHGFTIPEGLKRAVVVGGGIGTAPLLPLVEALAKAKVPTTVILGARCWDMLLAVEDFGQPGVEVLTVTEDGSCGTEGRVTDVLERVLQGTQVDYVYSCGPKPMLKAIAELATAHQVPGEVSLEEHMGCGVGACLACVCKTKPSHNGSDTIDTTNLQKFTYKRVCDHGPVFPIGEVVFDD